MENCTYCNTPVEGKFCSKCGQAHVCTKCGNKFTGNEKFCGYCGQPRINAQIITNTNQNYIEQKFPGQTNGNVPPLTVQSTPSQSLNNKSFKKVPKGIWIGLAAIILVVAIFIFIKGTNGPEKIAKSFIEAIDNGDFVTMRECVYGEEMYEFVSDYKDEMQDFHHLVTIKYDVLDVKKEKNNAEVTISMKYYVIDEEEPDSERVKLLLTKVKNDWLITGYEVD